MWAGDPGNTVFILVWHHQALIFMETLPVSDTGVSVLSLFIMPSHTIQTGPACSCSLLLAFIFSVWSFSAFPPCLKPAHFDSIVASLVLAFGVGVLGSLYNYACCCHKERMGDVVSDRLFLGHENMFLVFLCV